MLSALLRAKDSNHIIIRNCSLIGNQAAQMAKPAMSVALSLQTDTLLIEDCTFVGFSSSTSIGVLAVSELGSV